MILENKNVKYLCEVLTETEEKKRSKNFVF